MHFSLFTFFFNDTPTTEIYTLSLHDALPISSGAPDKTSAPQQSRAYLVSWYFQVPFSIFTITRARWSRPRKLSKDRKSTRLNSSHLGISYAVFCLKKKKNKKKRQNKNKQKRT